MELAGQDILGYRKPCVNSGRGSNGAGSGEMSRTFAAAVTPAPHTKVP